MWENEITIMKNAVRAAAAVSEAIAASMTRDDARLKQDASPVTLADYAVQAIVHRHLAAAFPGDAMIAEEDNDDLHDPRHAAMIERLAGLLAAREPGWSADELVAHIGRGHARESGRGRCWVLDPVDGTKGFLRGDQYAIALALLVDGRPVAGVLGCPRLELTTENGDSRRGWLCLGDGRRAWAESLDGGATRALKVNVKRNAADLVLCESVESGHSAHDVTGILAARQGVSARPLRMDSQAKYAAVAAGLADVYVRWPTRVDYREKIWDHAAGAVLVESAGGLVNDVRGQPLDFTCGRTLAANRGVLAGAGGMARDFLRMVEEHARATLP